MNVIGEIGRFIIEYQTEVEIMLITLAALILLILLIKAILNGKKKRETLFQISRTVAEINSAVHTMGEKRTDVIYIDTQTAQCKGREVSVRNGTIDLSPGVGAESRTAVTQGENQESEALYRENPKNMAGETETLSPETLKQEDRESTPRTMGEEIHIPKRFDSMDCAVDKTGKIYTIEELEEQIKE